MYYNYSVTGCVYSENSCTDPRLSGDIKYTVIASYAVPDTDRFAESRNSKTRLPHCRTTESYSLQSAIDRGATSTN